MPKLEKVDGFRDLFRHPESGRYYLRISVKGVGQVIRSTGHTDLRKAARALKEMHREIARYDESHVPHLYGDIAEECFDITQKKRRWRSRTEKEARYILHGHLIPAFGGMDIDRVTDAVWARQLTTWQRKTNRRAFDNVRKYAVMVDNYAVRKGYKRFRCDFPIEDPPKREGKVITPKQFKKLIAECERDDLRLFLLMGWTMGMRKSEILKLQTRKIDLNRRTIRLSADDVKTGSRTGRGREFAISPEALPLIRDRMGSPWLFPNEAGTGPIYDIKKAVWSLVKKTGIEFKPHDLRHSFLTRKLMDEKKAPILVSEYAGVSLRVIQSTYLHSKADHTRSVVDGEE